MSEQIRIEVCRRVTCLAEVTDVYTFPERLLKKVMREQELGRQEALEYIYENLRPYHAQVVWDNSYEEIDKILTEHEYVIDED